MKRTGHVVCELRFSVRKNNARSWNEQVTGLKLLNEQKDLRVLQSPEAKIVFTCSVCNNVKGPNTTFYCFQSKFPTRNTMRSQWNNVTLACRVRGWVGWGSMQWTLCSQQTTRTNRRILPFAIHWPERTLTRSASRSNQQSDLPQPSSLWTCCSPAITEKKIKVSRDFRIENKTILIPIKTKCLHKRNSQWKLTKIFTKSNNVNHWLQELYSEENLEHA